MANISIILPVYNSEKYILQTINSIINQTYTDWELIIIDDGSTDSCMKIIESIKSDKFIILHNDKNIGQALSKNKGISIATRKIYSFY